MTLILVVAIGWASQYAPNVMDKAIVNQQRYGHLPMRLPAVDGYVAVSDCKRMGEVVYIRPEGGEWERFLVTDCAGSDETRKWMSAQNILVEVDFRTAVRWNTVGGGKRICLALVGFTGLDADDYMGAR